MFDYPVRLVYIGPMIQVDVETAKLLSRLPETVVAAIIAAEGIAVSPRVAAKLTRRSPQVIRGALAEQSLPSAGDGSYQYVPIESLAQWAGRSSPYTAADFIASARRLGPSKGSDHAGR